MRISLLAVMLDYFRKPEETRKKFNIPVLVWSSEQDDKHPRRGEDTTLWGMRTKPRRGEPLVIPLEKKNPNDTSPISVGRSSDCDIDLSDPTISRRHCRFERDANNQWFIVDESRSGTFVEDQRLDANKRTPMPAKAKMRLGSADLAFFQPDEFFKYLESIQPPESAQE